MVRDAWERLGIAPTGEARDVKRTYAKLLKAIDPDADPAAFVALREAYEVALASGGEIPPWEQDEPDWGDDGQEDAPWDDHDAPLFEDALGDGGGWASERWRPPGPQALSGDLGVAARSLDALLFDAPDDEPDRIAALGAELLAAADLATVDEAGELERWLASAIALSIPRSDPLVAPAIRRFRWDGIGARAIQDWDIRTVLDRAEDIPFSRRCRKGGHPHHRAFAELTGPPRQKLGLFELGLATDVKDLLGIVRSAHPTVEREFDPRGLDFWDVYLRARYISPLRWIAILIAPLFLAELAAVAVQVAGLNLDIIPAFAGSAVLVLILVVVWKFTAERRLRYLDERRWQSGRWDRRIALYLGAALLLPPLAGAAPGGPLLAGLFTAAGLALFVLVWRALPPPPGEDEYYRGERRYFAIETGVVGAALVAGLPASASLNFALPLAALTLAAASGYEAAGHAFDRLRPAYRLLILTATALSLPLLGLAFWIAAPALPPAWIAAFVPVAVVVQHFATSASGRPTPELDWPTRVVAAIFYIAAGMALYEDDRARSIAAAVCLHAIIICLARLAIVGPALVRAPARPPEI